MEGVVSYFDQHEAEIRFEWGFAGVQSLAPISDVVIIVDVLSFTSCVDVVVGNGGIVFPYRGDKDSLVDYAKAVDAMVASRNREHHTGFSLSPHSLLKAPHGTRLVLPSPNGSRLSLATGDTQTMAGCLRNAKAVANQANRLGKRISVIAAGERWTDGTLRPSLEDLLGAGAILSYLQGTRSVEADTAVACFAHHQTNLLDVLLRCGSGKELVGRGFAEDVHIAGQFNVSTIAPVLVNGAYQLSDAS